ncbi:MAG: ABC transporter ATP-binding protein [Planctomycetes bacterium]|nr:ABC transporter ATP-binding protein [Planctomycetota bacterium]
MTDFAFETRSLRKTYGGQPALDGIDLTLGRGEVLGFVGPNGAGKSTFIKTLLGLVLPTSGTATVLGLWLREDSAAIRARIGYVPGDLGVYRNWTADDFLAFCIGFHPRGDLSRARAMARSMALPLGDRVRTYSTGMRQKLAIAQALCVHADLLLLDEPTRGLDPTSQLEFRDLVNAARREGSAVLLSSHILAEIESMCDRLVFIDRGRLIEASTIEALRARWRDRLYVETSGGDLATATDLPPGTAVERDGAGYRVSFVGDPKPVLEALVARGLVAIEYNRPTLEDLYRELYTRERER